MAIEKPLKEKLRPEQLRGDSSQSNNQGNNQTARQTSKPSATKTQLQESFQVTAVVKYIESESRPEESHYFFGYRITIMNCGNKPAQLISRHWIISDGNANIEEVRGAGVVGLQPHIPPGQSFEYESACPLSTNSGSMRGRYQMMDENGESFEIEIPEFYLLAPSALH